MPAFARPQPRQFRPDMTDGSRNQGTRSRAPITQTGYVGATSKPALAPALACGSIAEAWVNVTTNPTPEWIARQ